MKITAPKRMWNGPSPERVMSREGFPLHRKKLVVYIMKYLIKLLSVGS